MGAARQIRKTAKEEEKPGALAAVGPELNDQSGEGPRGPGGCQLFFLFLEAANFDLIF